MNSTNDNNKKILIIDDDLNTRSAITEELRFQKYVIIEAEDGESGLEKALIEKPDLILLDIMLPKLNGLEVIKKLREDSWGKSASVIIISSLNTSDEILNDIIKNSPIYYIMKKDLNLKDLSEKIKIILNDKIN